MSKEEITRRLDSIDQKLRYNWAKNLIGVLAGAAAAGTFALISSDMQIKAENKRSDPLHLAFRTQAAESYGKMLTMMHTIEDKVQEYCTLSPPPQDWPQSVKADLQTLTTVVITRPPLVEEALAANVEEFADLLAQNVDNLNEDSCSDVLEKAKQVKSEINRIARGE